MKKTWKAYLRGGVFLALLALLAGCQSGDNTMLGGEAVAAESSREPGGRARKIIVFQPDVSQAAQDEILARNGAAKVKSLSIINGAVALIGPANEQALQRHPGILRIEQDAVAQVLGKPDTAAKPQPKPPAPSGEGLPWGVDRIDAELVWDANRDLAVDAGANAGAGVTVAVIDTGIDLTHPDLQANIVGGYNAINPALSANDDNGHGTHVAGTIAGVDNTIGVLGVAPQASLLAVKVLDAQGSGYYSDIIEGIQWSIGKAQVINMSLGGTTSIQSFHDAVKQAYNAGIVIVAAAGNSGPKDNTVNYPAKYPEVIAVSATDSSNKLPRWSSRGPEVELAAPGASIYSTARGGGYTTMSGTSMASPHVAGVAALVRAGGASGVEAIRTILRQTADDFGAAGKDNLYGFGLVDAEEAVTGSQTNP